ncbi:MAG: zinc-binding protein [candidate division WS1 bacterium]|nr:zinc-binding protein [candidate division WS1 bacterium]
MQSGCSCGGAITMILACSGGSNVGQISNEVARKLTVDNKGVMFCLAGLGGDVEPLIERTKSAGRVLVIDGCPVACAKKTLERHGIEHEWLELTSLGIEKCPSLELDGCEVACAMEAAEKCLEA